MERCRATLHGHGFSGSGYETARYLALPDVGFPRSRGRIHGLALWMPPGATAIEHQKARDAAMAIQRLTGRGIDISVVPRGNERYPQASYPRRWLASSHAWVTAFPAIHERRRTLDLPEVSRWCCHAGLPAPVAFHSARTPLTPGAIDLAPVEVNRPGRPGLPYSHVKLGSPSRFRGRLSLVLLGNADSDSAYRSMSKRESDTAVPTFPTQRSGMPSMPTFVEFYRAINGRDPFPWQTRLAKLVATSQQWPNEAKVVGIPTGLGKTTCLEIAVWWLASQAAREPASRTAPTRVWWVVNRHLLVDSTACHARLIADRLVKPVSAGLSRQAEKVLTKVANRLRSLAADPNADPLEVIRLRGGVSSRIPIDPSQPTVLLCTLPMYGSRLLFRGYGSRRPAIDAAMAGTDSLVLLDEAHLAPHLRSLVRALADCIPGAQNTLERSRSTTTMVALTATGDAADSQQFDLDLDDEAHPVVRQRLNATKSLELRIETGDIAARLADATLDLLQGARAPAACLVFANTPKTARETFVCLQKATAVKKDADLLLLTGLMREREAKKVRARILHPQDGMAADRETEAVRQCHLIVVATQTLEVGADIDAEYLVTEACGRRALTQRLGRLNRFGRFTYARAAYVHIPPSRNTGVWPVYGEEPKGVLCRLQRELRQNGAGTVNLSPRKVIEVLGPPCDSPGRSPEILPEILWEWTKTTTRPDGEAPVEPYFSGIAGPQYSVSLMWRIHIPDKGRRLWPRPRDSEAIDVPIAEVRDVLGSGDFHRLAPDGVTVEGVSCANMRSGDQIVLPIDRGLMGEFGWDPFASEPIVDVSLIGSGLPLDAESINRLCGCDVALGELVDIALGIGQDSEKIEQSDRSKAMTEILDAIRAVPTPPGWDRSEWDCFTSTLTPNVREARGEVPRLSTEKPIPEERNDNFDEVSLGEVVELDLHGENVGARAETIACRLGLSPDLAEVIAKAAKLHDIGKADRRFQRWLNPDETLGVLVAKSNTPRHRWEMMRVNSGWPRGGRHEELSARLVRAWLEQKPAWGSFIERDLLIHLVISHHGKGRPLVSPVSDGTLDVVSAIVDDVSVEVPANLAVTDWEQPARFRRLNRHFGPWGLALLETIVICADRAVSAWVQKEPGV